MFAKMIVPTTVYVDRGEEADYFDVNGERRISSEGLATTGRPTSTPSSRSTSVASLWGSGESLVSATRRTSVFLKANIAHVSTLITSSETKNDLTPEEQELSDLLADRKVANALANEDICVKILFYWAAGRILAEKSRKQRRSKKKALYGIFFERPFFRMTNFPQALADELSTRPTRDALVRAQKHLAPELLADPRVADFLRKFRKERAVAGSVGH